MRILLINNDGGGFADYIEIENNTTVEDLFLDQVGGEASDCLIRVNRQPCPSDQILKEGDRISITPTKIEGARGHVSWRTMRAYARLMKIRSRWSLR
jgi:sulfur carrier protein ThiS